MSLYKLKMIQSQKGIQQNKYQEENSHIEQSIKSNIYSQIKQLKIQQLKGSNEPQGSSQQSEPVISQQLFDPQQSKKKSLLQFHGSITSQRESEQNRNRHSSSSHSLQSLNLNFKDSTIGVITSQIKELQQAVEEMKPEVQVQIIQTVEKGHFLSKYILYTIKGKDLHGAFFIRRKYSQFSALRKILLQRWPGCYIPGLRAQLQIKDQLQKNKVQKSILINFLISLSYFKHIYYKQQIQLFLRSPDIDIEQMFQQMPVLRKTDIIDRYLSHYGQEFQKSGGLQVSQVISRFHVKLRKIVNNLGYMSQKTLNLAQSYHVYKQSIKNFGNAMRMYEQFNLAEYTQNNRQMTVMIQDQQNHIQKMRAVYNQNPFYELYGLIQMQANDTKSFLDVVIAIGLFTLRQQQLQKQILKIQSSFSQIQEGHKTLKTITSRRPKQEIKFQLEERIRSLQIQKSEVTKLYNVVQNVIVQQIIPTFKFIKKNNYRNIIIKWIKFAQLQIPELEHIWKFINDQSKSMLKRYNN